MQKKLLEKAKGLKPKQQAMIGGAMLLVILVIAFVFFRPPERSVAAYCKVYKDENAKLLHQGEDKYSAGIFTSSVNDPHKFAEAYSKLEQVAPEDVRPDVKTLRQVFQKIDSDPTQSLGAGLSGLGAESSIKDWTTKHCPQS